MSKITKPWIRMWLYGVIFFPSADANDSNKEEEVGGGGRTLEESRVAARAVV